MGANIVLSQDGQTSIIKGMQALNDAVIEAKDLLSGAALVLAGLSARGETIVTDTGHIARGYEDLTRDLAALGAKIAYQPTAQ